MVAVQVLLMNYYLLGLHSDKHLTNDVLPPRSVIPPPNACPLGCTSCSMSNGCLSCKRPFVLVLHREALTERGHCKMDCPKGYYSSFNGNSGFCINRQIRGCKWCNSESHCSKCHRKRIKLKNNCHRKCPKRSYFDAACKGCLQKTRNGPEFDIGIGRNWTWTQGQPSKTGVNDVTLEIPARPMTKKEIRLLKQKRRKRKRRRRRRKKKRRNKQKRKKNGKRNRKRSRKRHWRGRKRRRKEKDWKNFKYNYTITR